MICSSQESDETRWFSSTRYFRLPSTGKCLNFFRLEAIQVSTARKEKSSSTNHFTSSSSKLAISSHAATFVDQSFWWFNGVIKFLRSLWRLPFTTQSGRHRTNSSREMRLSFNIHIQGWRWWRKKLGICSHFLLFSSSHVLWVRSSMLQGEHRGKLKTYF